MLAMLLVTKVATEKQPNFEYLFILNHSSLFIMTETLPVIYWRHDCQPLLHTFYGVTLLELKVVEIGCIFSRICQRAGRRSGRVWGARSHPN